MPHAPGRPRVDPSARAREVNPSPIDYGGLSWPTSLLPTSWPAHREEPLMQAHTDLPAGVRRWRHLTLHCSKTDVDLDAEPQLQRSWPGEPPVCPEVPVLRTVLAQLTLWRDSGDLLADQAAVVEEAVPVVAARLAQAEATQAFVAPRARL